MIDIEFGISFMRNVKNNVYISIYSKIIDMLEEANFEHEFMIDNIVLLKGHNITRAMLRDSMKHEDTPEIQAMQKKRREMLASLRDVVDRLSKMPGFATEEHARVLQKWIKEYRRQIASRNVMDEALVAYGIEMDVGYYNHVRVALQESRLMDFVNNLIEYNHELINKEITRHEDNEAMTLKYDRKIGSYEDLRRALYVLVSLAKAGRREEDRELAAMVASDLNTLLRRERGYVKMVETKKKMKEGGDLGETDD